MLAPSADLNLGAISGLFYNQGKLIMIQNGFQPQRIMRLELDANGTMVTEAIPLASALADFDRPAFGTIKDDDVYYFANPGENQTVNVMKTPLNPEETIESPEMRKMKDQIKGIQ